MHPLLMVTPVVFTLTSSFFLLCLSSHVTAEMIQLDVQFLISSIKQVIFEHSVSDLCHPATDVSRSNGCHWNGGTSLSALQA